jgi:hypothetical protein
MENIKRIKELLNSLHRKHLECEDCWYSCPKSDEGCCDSDKDKNVCDCGADYTNNKIDEILSLLDIIFIPPTNLR